MAEREHGVGRQADEAVAHPADFEPAVSRETVALVPKPARLAARPDKGLPFAEALDETMRDHRAVFAALAK